MPASFAHSLTQNDTIRVSAFERAECADDWNELSRLPELEGAIRACPDQYFVTLTSRRSLTAGVMSAEVGKVLHKVNAKLFGNHYSRKKSVRLATFTVQERTLAEGLHSHLIIGVPEGSLALKANPTAMEPGALIISEWIRADPEGRRITGQDSRAVFDFTGLSAYARKGIRSREGFDNVDLHNCSLPYSRLPRH